MNYFLDAMKNKYAQFTGRATRSEHWYFVLFMSIVDVIAVIIDVLLSDLTGGMPIVTGITMLIFVIPLTAVGIRRLHDINADGLWYLLAYVPILFLILIILLVIDSKEDNAYGPNPKSIV